MSKLTQFTVVTVVFVVETVLFPLVVELFEATSVTAAIAYSGLETNTITPTRRATAPSNNSPNNGL